MRIHPLATCPVLLTIVLLSSVPCHAEDHPAAPGTTGAHSVAGTVSAEEALSELKAGNQRYVSGAMTHSHQDAARRAAVATGQKPIAIIVGCADSRVAPEVIFDQGLGDLFVLRVAGNVIDDNLLGSIEYAVEHLGTQLVVVLGHERCGAVSSARAAIADGSRIDSHIASLVDEIRPAVLTINGKTDTVAQNSSEADKVDATVVENAQNSARELRESPPVLAECVNLKVYAARYDLDTGAVAFFDPK